MAATATERQQKHYTGLRTATQKYQALQRHVVEAGIFDRQSHYQRGRRWLDTEPLPVDLCTCAADHGPGIKTMERLWSEAKRRAPGGLLPCDLHALEMLVEARYAALALGSALPPNEGDPSPQNWIKAREFWRKREAEARKMLAAIDILPLELLLPESATGPKAGARTGKGKELADLAHNC